jgi:hypothetical protein
MEHSKLTLEIVSSCSGCSQLSLVRDQNTAKIITIGYQPFNGSSSSYRRPFQLFVRLD